MLTLLIKEDVSEADRKKLLASFLENTSNSKEDLWGVRSLSYPIQHLDKAYYAHLEFQAEPSSIPPLDKKLKLEEDVIRYLLVKAKISKKVAKVKKEAKKEEIKEEKAEEVVAAV